MKRRLLDTLDPAEGRGWSSIRNQTARTSRPGPENLRELFKWPERVAQDLARNYSVDGSDGEGEARMMRLNAVLDRGLGIDSLYSGFDCPRWALEPTRDFIIKERGWTFRNLVPKG